MGRALSYTGQNPSDSGGDGCYPREAVFMNGEILEFFFTPKRVSPLDLGEVSESQEP